jgi:hypothetical protein
MYKNLLNALFILSLLNEHTSTCFGHINSPSSGGRMYRSTIFHVYTYHLLMMVCWYARNMWRYIDDWLVFSPWAGFGRNQSPVRRPVWLWHAAFWASEGIHVYICIYTYTYIHTYIYPTRYNNAQYIFFISLNIYSTYFGCHLHPPSGVQKTAVVDP